MKNRLIVDIYWWALSATWCCKKFTIIHAQNIVVQKFLSELRGIRPHPPASPLDPPLNARTCLVVMVMLAAVDDTELSGFVVEQLTWLHCAWWHVIEMLTSFIQSTHHRTADVSAHSLWRIAFDIRKARNTQELLSGILRTFSGEESSCCVFQDDEDCEKKRSSFRDERHRPSVSLAAMLTVNIYRDLPGNRWRAWTTSEVCGSSDILLRCQSAFNEECLQDILMSWTRCTAIIDYSRRIITICIPPSTP